MALLDYTSPLDRRRHRSPRRPPRQVASQIHHANRAISHVLKIIAASQPRAPRQPRTSRPAPSRTGRVYPHHAATQQHRQLAHLDRRIAQVQRHLTHAQTQVLLHPSPFHAHTTIPAAVTAATRLGHLQAERAYVAGKVEQRKIQRQARKHPGDALSAPLHAAEHFLSGTSKDVKGVLGLPRKTTGVERFVRESVFPQNAGDVAALAAGLGAEAVAARGAGALARAASTAARAGGRTAARTAEEAASTRGLRTVSGGSARAPRATRGAVRGLRPVSGETTAGRVAGRARYATRAPARGASRVSTGARLAASRGAGRVAARITPAQRAAAARVVASKPVSAVRTAGRTVAPVVKPVARVASLPVRRPVATAAIAGTTALAPIPGIQPQLQKEIQGNGVIASALKSAGDFASKFTPGVFDNAIKDIFELPAEIVPSVYLPAAALFDKFVNGDSAKFDQLWSEYKRTGFFPGLVDAIKSGSATDLWNRIKAHPIFTGLEAAGGYHLAGRAAGLAARGVTRGRVMAPAEKPGIEQLPRVGEQPPLVEPGRPYSRHPLNRGVQRRRVAKRTAAEGRQAGQPFKATLKERQAFWRGTYRPPEAGGRVAFGARSAAAIEATRRAGRSEAVGRIASARPTGGRTGLRLPTPARTNIDALVQWVATNELHESDFHSSTTALLKQYEAHSGTLPSKVMEKANAENIKLARFALTLHPEVIQRVIESAHNYRSFHNPAEEALAARLGVPLERFLKAAEIPRAAAHEAATYGVPAEALAARQAVPRLEKQLAALGREHQKLRRQRGRVAVRQDVFESMPVARSVGQREAAVRSGDVYRAYSPLVDEILRSKNSTLIADARTRIAGDGRLSRGRREALLARIDRGKPARPASAVLSTRLRRAAEPGTGLGASRFAVEQRRVRLAARRQAIEQRLGAIPGQRQTLKESLAQAKALRGAREQVLTASGGRYPLEQMQAERQAQGLPRPAFASQRSYARMATAMFRSFWPDRERIPGGVTGRRTGLASARGTARPSYDNLVRQAALTVGRLRAVIAHDRELADISRHPADRYFDTPQEARDAAASPDSAGMSEAQLPTLDAGDPLRGWSPAWVAASQATASELAQAIHEIEANQRKIGGVPEAINDVPGEGDTDALIANIIARTFPDPAKGEAVPPDGKIVLVPTEYAKQMRDNFRGSLGAEKLVQAAVSQFKGTVLPLSTRWVLGNYFDISMRKFMAGVIPVHDRAFMKKLIAEINGLDSEAARSLQARFAGGTLYGSYGSGKYFRKDAQLYAGSRARGFVEKLQALSQAPGIRHAMDAWHAYRDTVFAANSLAIESRGQLAVGGKVARQQMARNLGSWHKALRAQGPAFEDLARGYLDTPAQNAFAAQVEEVLGRWTANTAGTRKLLADYAPFYMWARAAVRFVGVTLPIRHPVKLGLLAAAANMTQSERQLLGLSEFTDDRVPAFLQGAIPAGLSLSGGLHTTAGYTPVGYLSTFGVFADLPTFANQAILPELPLDALRGLDWTGKKITNADGTELSAPQRIAYATYVASEGFIPLEQLGRRIMEGGGTSQPLSTFLSPKSTPVAAQPLTLDAGLARVFIPVRTYSPELVAYLRTLTSGGAQPSSALPVNPYSQIGSTAGAASNPYSAIGSSSGGTNPYSQIGK